MPDIIEYLGPLDTKGKNQIEYLGPLKQENKIEYLGPLEKPYCPWEHPVKEGLKGVGKEALQSFTPENIGKNLLAAGEAAGALTTGMTGFVAGVPPLVIGGPKYGMKAAEKVGEAVTYQPKTEQGRQLTGIVSKPFELLTMGEDKFAEWAMSQYKTLEETEKEIGDKELAQILHNADLSPKTREWMARSIFRVGLVGLPLLKKVFGRTITPAEAVKETIKNPEMAKELKIEAPPVEITKPIEPVKPVGEVKPAEAPKQPWEMTREEFNKTAWHDSTLETPLKSGEKLAPGGIGLNNRIYKEGKLVNLSPEEVRQRFVDQSRLKLEAPKQPFVEEPIKVEPTPTGKKIKADIQEVPKVGTSTTADIGGYSGKMKTVEMPEMVQMAKELLEGKYPLVRKSLRAAKGQARGVFWGGKGKIALRADMFKDLNEAQYVLGHEIGHAVDWLPDKYLKRGNILGRIAALKESYRKNIYEQLSTSKEISSELKALTQILKPFDISGDKNFTKYRHSSKELYADAITTLINDPELLKTNAPKFYDGFFEYISRKPEVKRIYDDIQELISNGREPETRVKNLRTMFERGDKAYELSVKKPRTADEIKTDFVDVDHFVIKKIKGVNEATLPVEKNPRYKLEEMRYTTSEVEPLINDIKHEIVKPLKSGGFTWDDFGEYLFHKRVSIERAEIANPLGWNTELSSRRLKTWKDSVGEERFKVLEKAGEDYQKYHTDVLEKAKKAKMFSPDLFEKIKDNKNYATYDVIDYIEQRQGRLISSKIYEQVGTLNEISNPATATLLKDVSLMKSINRNIASKSVVDFMKEYYPNEIKPADTKWNGKFQEIVKSKNPEEGLLVYLEDGKAKGFYVDKYIEGSFKSNPIEAMAISKILRGVAQPFRAVFTQYNPGFWGFNIYRDYFRMSRNLSGGNLLNLSKHYADSIKPAFRSTFDIPDATTQTMLKEKMMISSVDWRGTVPENLQLEQFLKKASLEKTRWDNVVIKPFGKFFNYMSNAAKAMERIPKIASYKYLKEKFPDMSTTEMAHIIRTQAGSPDFLRKGKAFPIYNNILLFSNAIKEGYRGDYSAYSRNPQGFMWKQAKYSILPKVVIYTATLGLLGNGIKQIMDSASEYDKANYGIIPLGITKNGKGVYLRVPTDETSRFFGGIFWKLLNLNKTKNLSNVFDYMAGQAPTLNPGLDVFVDIAQYASGQNPYDSFKGRYAIPEKVFEASDIRTHEAFGKYIFNKIGTNVVYRFQYDDGVRVKSEIEKVLNYPILGNIIGRFIKISDYGIREELRGAKEEYRMFNARENLDAHEALAKIINGEKITPKEAEIIKKHPDLVSRNIEILLGKKVGNAYLEEFLTARDNNEKIIVLDKIIKMNNKMEE